MDKQKLGKKNYKTGMLSSLVATLCHWFKVVENCVGWLSVCFWFSPFTCVRQVVILGNIVSRLNFGSNFFANNLHFIILIVKIRIIWFLYDQPWQMSSRIEYFFTTFSFEIYFFWMKIWVLTINILCNERSLRIYNLIEMNKNNDKSLKPLFIWKIGFRASYLLLFPYKKTT